MYAQNYKAKHEFSVFIIVLNVFKINSKDTSGVIPVSLLLKTPLGICFFWLELRMKKFLRSISKQIAVFSEPIS